MPRTNVTLQPSKRTVTISATQIFAAYVAAGNVPDEQNAQRWIDRAVNEAIAIAQQVDQSVQSDEELPDNGKQRLRNWPDDDEEMPEIGPSE